MAKPCSMDGLFNILQGTDKRVSFLADSCRTNPPSNQQPFMLDLMITSESVLVSNVKILPPLGKSDHVVPQFQLQLFYIVHQKQNTTLRKFINFPNLNDDMSQVDWRQKLSHLTVEKTGKFHDITNSLMEEHTDIETLR
ncbi:hypothetical protein JTB14_034258 [Gonioctena quinquepunctata]|nr:hypothetical protein JTB14_034258 [Gonioctena quinquepunctata]